MKRSSGPVLACAVTLLAPAFARAQATPGAGAEGARSGAAPASLSFLTVPHVDGEKANTSVVQFSLDSSAKDRFGTIALGWQHGSGNVQLKLSGPLDSSDETEPLSLTGLARGASARLAVNRFGWRPPTLHEQQQAVALCADPRLAGKTCSVRGLAADFPAESARLAALEHLYDKPWLFGAEASVTQRGFQFLRSDTLAADSEDHVGFSVQARVGIFSPSLGFLSASASYERDFEPAARPSDICRPIAGTSATRCQMVVVGSPVEANQSGVGVELRRFFTSNANTGISPSLRYDFDADTWLAEVPLYVIPGKGKVSGGIRFGWRSDTKDVSAVVFVGTIFDLFGS